MYAEWSDDKNTKQTIGLKPLNKSAEHITLEDVVGIIKQKASVLSQEDAAAMFLPQSLIDREDEDYESSSSQPYELLNGLSSSVYGVTKSNVTSSTSAPSGGTTSDKTLLRTLRPDLSIRKGKYGPYIFHKSSQMTKPAFHPIKPLKDKWESMANLELIAAIENVYHLTGGIK